MPPAHLAGELAGDRAAGDVYELLGQDGRQQVVAGGTTALAIAANIGGRWAWASRY
ncbi:MAG: hypothetical protein U0992_00430 [Planctomycetaceae bacterium]